MVVFVIFGHDKMLFFFFFAEVVSFHFSYLHLSQLCPTGLNFS